VALFVALGGGAYAATSSDTKSDKKIAKKAAKAYFNGHIAGASVSHANTAGSATNATTATNATNATHASSAAALDNFQPQKLSWRVANNTSAQTIYTSPGGFLTVTAACGSTSGITLTFTTSVDHAILNSYGTESDINQGDFLVASPQTFTNTSEERTVVYTAPGGQQATLIYGVTNSPGLSGVNCVLHGTAFAN
jgi:hypothetical protein